MNRRIYSIALCALFLFSCASSNAMRTDSDIGSDPLSAIIRFYEGPLDHLSAVRAGECPMHPSCSEYAKIAVRKHGAVIGWMMTSDRLMRCGRDELNLSPKVLIEGRLTTYDPVSNNDFWWSTDQSKDSR